ITDSGGIPNVAVVELATGTSRALTALASAASDPEPGHAGHTVYFLRLHADGLDLAAVADTALLPATLATSPALQPATIPPRAPADSFPRAALEPSRSYGLGPRNVIVLPTLGVGAEGKSLGAVVAGTDPVGRLTWIATGVYGDRGTWRGGSLAAAWRGWPVTIAAEGFYADEHPSRQHGGLAAPVFLDARYAGGDAVASLERQYTGAAHAIRTGISLGQLDGDAYARQTRMVAFADYRGAFRQTPNEWRFGERVGIAGAAGRTLGAQAMVGQSARGAPAYEQFVLGGTSPSLFDDALASQRAAMPAAPLGLAGGERVASYRVDLPLWLFSPYLWGGSAGNELHDWHRYVGLEASLDETGIWAIHVPNMHVLGGIAYSLDRPTRHRTSVYLEWRYRP